jgi:hypothetical protein
VKCFVTLLTIPHFEEPENNTITTIKEITNNIFKRRKAYKRGIVGSLFPFNLVQKQTNR